MLEESERMIADTDNRLGAAVHDLRDVIVSLFHFASLNISSVPHAVSPTPSLYRTRDRYNPRMIRPCPRHRNY